MVVTATVASGHEIQFPEVVSYMASWLMEVGSYVIYILRSFPELK